MLPVILIGRHHLRSIDRGGLRAGLGHPGVPHQHHLGLTPSLEGGLPVGADQAYGALQIGAGGGDKGIAEPPGSPRGCRDAGADPQRRGWHLIWPGADVEVIQAVVRAAKRKGLAAPAPADNLHTLLEQRHPVFHRHGEGLKISGLIADPYAQNDPPFGD